MMKVLCYFCEKLDEHLTENCPEYRTLRERNLVVQQRQHKNCLCGRADGGGVKSAVCHCQTICSACFQNHDIAMCPKRDPFHPINLIAKPEPLNIFKLEYATVKRFFELCNPMDQHKLRRCGKYFNKFETVPLQLVYRYSPTHPFDNVVLNGMGFFQYKNEIAILQTKLKHYFNFECISLKNCSINGADLKFLAKGDPYSVTINNCIIAENFLFQYILNTFQYATEFKFINQKIPSTWILNVLNAERNVDFRKIELEDDASCFSLPDLITLFVQNKNLSLIITVKEKYLSDVPIINTLLASKRFTYKFGGISNFFDICFRSSQSGGHVVLNFIHCYFCKQITHASECCPDFPTLKSRYSEIFKRKQSNCLCPNYAPISEDYPMCRCRKICAICFQHHHIAMCPKRDPEYRSNPLLMPEPLSLFSHHSPFAKRFFELSNPIDQFKLQNCCKYFKSLQPVKLKLDYRYSKNHRYPNIVFNGMGTFEFGNDISLLQPKTTNYFNLDNISLNDCYIGEADLRLLEKGDPHSVSIENCSLARSVSFQNILNAFPYALEFKFMNHKIPSTWILNFLNAERKVGIRIIEIEDNVLDFGVDDLIRLFGQGDNLTLTITVKQKKPSDVPVINSIKTSQNFAETPKKENFDLGFKFVMEDPDEFFCMYFRYITLHA